MMPKRLRYLSLLFASFVLMPLYALELGEIETHSEIGQALNIKVMLSATEADSLVDWYPVVADQDDYRTLGLEYVGGLHDRLVMEIITAADSPYVAISSIGEIGRQRFDLIVSISNGIESRRRVYQAVLKEPPPPPPPVVETMPAAELLNYLINQLAATQLDDTRLSDSQPDDTQATAAQDLIRAELWGALKMLTTAAPPGGEQEFIVRLHSVDLEPSFVAGIIGLLNAQQNAIFARVKAESGSVQAVAAVLFGEQDFSVLKALFAAATQSTLVPGETKSERLNFAKERAAILANQLYETQYAMLQQQRAKAAAAAAPNEKTVSPNYPNWRQIYATVAQQLDGVDWLDASNWGEIYAVLASALSAVSWADYLSWQQGGLFAKTSFWIGITIFLGFLLLLLSIRLLRVQKTAVTRNASTRDESTRNRRTNLPLPGQAELERVRIPKVHINAPPEVPKDAFDDKLDQAEAFVAMGEHDEAQRLLKVVEQRSRNEQQLARALSLRSKIERK